MDEVRDVVVVGAGIAGAAAARRMSAAGLATVVLERARGVGGRCAVRRIDGRPVDFGLPFLHGRDPAFLAELDAVPAARVEGWPAVREGGGLPCRPEAFDGPDRLLAFREGLNALPRHLASTLDVRLGAAVASLAAGPSDTVVVTTAGGDRFRARAVLLTPPPPHVRPLLSSLLATEPALGRFTSVLDQVRFVPCLTLIAEYAAGTPRPAWDVSLPRISTAVHAILNDSSKRGPDAPLILVLQAGIGYSRAHLVADPAAWVPGLLAEAARLHGPWIARPERATPHVWEHARVQRPTELARHVLLALANGARIGFCGDGFSPAGGAEGAYRSGLGAADEILSLLAAAASTHGDSSASHPE